MSTNEIVRFDDFTLKKCKIAKDGIEASFDKKAVIDDQAQVIEYDVKAKYFPHPDILKLRNKLREYLVKAYHLDEGYEEALKYLKGEQKKNTQEKMMDLYDKIEVTGISIGGDDQLHPLCDRSVDAALGPWPEPDPAQYRADLAGAVHDLLRHAARVRGRP